MNAVQFPINQQMAGQVVAPLQQNVGDNPQQLMTVIPAEASQVFQNYMLAVEQRMKDLEAANAALMNQQVGALDQGVIATARRVDEQQEFIEQLQKKLEKEQERARRIEIRFNEADQQKDELGKLIRLQQAQMQKVIANYQINDAALRQQQQVQHDLVLKVQKLNAHLAVAQVNNDDLIEKNRLLQAQQAQEQLRILAEQEMQQKRAGWTQERNELLAKRKPFEEWHAKVYDTANAAAMSCAVLGGNFGPLGSFFSAILAPVVEGVVIGANNEELLNNGREIQQIDAGIRRLDGLLGGEPTKLEPLHLAPLTQLAEKFI